ncbi:MAG: hypothetical protein EB168_02690 [Euryarchaeota archaeon]|jgi:hypothetical protein|nr:hypothetical protein [Euryarchaeota archaeon]
MRDHLLDLVGHTYDLGCIDLVKISGTDDATVIDGLAEDRSVVVQAAFKQPVSEFVGTFGMPNLSKLKVLLGLEPYKENAKITIKRQERNGASVPVGLNFENAAGDFKNDYRFMTSEIIEEKLKVVKFKGVEWNITFQPTIAGVQRLKYQALANAEELTFNAKTEGNDLKLEFGDHSTHAGSFIFHPDVGGKLARAWAWPVKQFISILDLTGDKTINISDQGAAQITVDSGLAVYNYILPAQSK